MSELPVTRMRVSAARQALIRDSVRQAEGIPFGTFPSRLAGLEDAQAFLTFLEDPAIHEPIYNLPKPLNIASVTAFIEHKLDARTAGDGLLFLRFDEAGEVVGYSEIDLWPEWGAGDLGGALRPDQQGKRAGVDGARQTFTWMFNTLHLDLIVATGALDNVRTARMLDGLGFARMGEMTNRRPDGTQRPSIIWEMKRDAWFELQP